MNNSPATADQPKKNWFARHKVLTVIGVLVLIGAIGSGMNQNKKDAADSGSQTAAGQQAAQSKEPPAGDAAPADAPAEDTAMPGIGQPAQAGDFEFTVTEVETGVASVGGEYFSEDAQGQFVLVHVNVTNVGDKAETLTSSLQKLVDDQGREHEADSSAAIYIEDSNTLYERVNPGNSVSGVLVFDIPADATPVSVKLQQGFNSSVEVSLK
ncbi:DUF4352 domain-containing protein [Gulosibacter bifidus]|uniref:DUF4352 domain-containing protein n=1 Tax=Gulosibacter bifidus TaxID=272239 RepID=A0ABW5RK73_9MICO|nr:DUF4352 domain-containing protein [Gulosibacter bifidus]